MKTLLLLCALALPAICSAQGEPTYETRKDISYHEGAALEAEDAYQKEICKLDVRAPAGGKDLPTIIWFHGGGFTGGSRNFPAVKDPKAVLVSASYRLSPKGEFPCFLEDGAAATAWTIRHITEFGGDPKKVFVGGHSAGGYLALMIGLDPKWLAPYQISNKSLAGLIPVSAQVTTHFHVKKLRGDTGEALRPLIDEYAPLYYASKDLQPILLITGDRKIEYKSRVEENDLFAISLKNLGHPDVEFHELPGLDHGTVAKGAGPFIMPFVERVSARISAP